MNTACNYLTLILNNMIYTKEINDMCVVAKGPNHGPAPIPEEGKWIQSKEIKDISGLTHGVGWCAPQQGACKLTLNVKNGIIEEALVETIGCSGMTHSAAMASEILPGKTILEALNTDLVCDAINTAMRELFLQIVYGRTQSAFSEGGLAIGAGLEDLGKGLISQTGTLYGTKVKGTRYLQLTEGYITKMFLDADNQVCGYEFVHMGKFMDAIKKADSGLSYLWVGGQTTINSDGETVTAKWSDGSSTSYLDSAKLWFGHEPSGKDGSTLEPYMMLWNPGSGWSFNDNSDSCVGIYASGTIGYVCQFTE